MVTRTQLASDSFTGVDGAGLGANWSGCNTNNEGSGEIRSNGASTHFLNAMTGAQGMSALWAGSLTGGGGMPNDQSSECLVHGSTSWTTSYYTGVIVRAAGNNATSNFYGCIACCDGSQTTILFKVINSVYTSLASTSHAWAAGVTNRMRVDVLGTSLKVYDNDVEIVALATTDSSIASGAFGIIVSTDGTAALRLDDWKGFSLDAGVGATLSGSAGTGGTGTMPPTFSIGL